MTIASSAGCFTARPPELTVWHMLACLLVVRGVSPGCRLFGSASMVESFSVEFLFLKLICKVPVPDVPEPKFYKIFTVCCLAFARCMGNYYVWGGYDFVYYDGCFFCVS